MPKDQVELITIKDIVNLEKDRFILVKHPKLKKFMVVMHLDHFERLINYPIQVKVIKKSTGGK